MMSVMRMFSLAEGEERMLWTVNRGNESSSGGDERSRGHEMVAVEGVVPRE